MLVFRAEVVVGIVSALIRIVLVMLVWQAVYGERDVVSGIERADAVGYAVLGALFAVVFQPWQFSTLQSRVRTGNIVFDIMRPVGIVTQATAAQLGTSLANLPKVIVCLVLALSIGSVPASSTWWQTIAFAVSTVFGLTIAIQCNLIVGMTAFWTTEASGAYVIYNMAAAFCSGSLIPLWFMPDGLADVLRLLPFSAQIFTPLSIWFDRSPGWNIVGELLLQIGWILLLSLIAYLVNMRAVHRTVINGG
ncbi:ABC-2 type transport system permease protein [Microbacterium natoriense]|uniref:ABC-2 type transport system permease protein n=1 Tax=Microbacterium natoriense TaxID=284570 RepID=A0AAW8EZ71_9MICO|nr:ABC-2 family transporter protein [Microbacterium natoriense]MDQ0648533.1 ABC-2 type transport system permease protein [Microbacterium natoriense]